MNPLADFDREGLLLSQGSALIGVDEAGRGAWAGPVCAGAVFLKKELYEAVDFLECVKEAHDSKKLTAPLRTAIFEQLVSFKSNGKINWSVGWGSVEEIEAHNIVGATVLAMRRALKALVKPSQVQDPEGVDLFCNQSGPIVWVDGLYFKKLGYPHKAWVQGDGRSLAIALASIIAKVSRDRAMEDLCKLHPQYGFSQHKGYGTPAHQAALKKQGLTKIHRPSFIAISP